jgi:hypothetical protein
VQKHRLKHARYSGKPIFRLAIQIALPDDALSRLALGLRVKRRLVF